MLIKNIEVVDRWREAKQKVYSVMRQLNASFEPLALVYLFIVNLATFLPNCSILFKNSDPFPTVISQIFRIFLLTNLNATFGINQQIIAAIVIVYCLMVVVLMVAHFIFTQVFTFCTKMLCLLLRLGQFLVVPLADYGAHCYSQFYNPNSTISIRILSSIVLVLLITSAVALVVYLKFNIRVLRKKNIFWNLDNDLHVYALVYLIYKAVLLSFTQITISICFLSLVVWYFHHQMKGGCIVRCARVIEYSPYNYVAAADLGVLLSIVTKSQYFGLNVWIFGVGSLVIYCIVQLYLSSKGKLYIPVCISGPEQFYNFYYEFGEQFKSEDMRPLLSKKNYSSAHQLHRIHCHKQKCVLTPPSSVENEQAVQTVVTGFITNHRAKNLTNRLIFELWNLQLGRKCEVQHLAQKTLTFKQDFILHCIENLTRDSEVTIRTSESNKGAVSKVFYDLIFEISSDYSQFYEQLARTHPKIDAVVRLGIGIRKKVGKLKAAYAELLRSKLINFKMIELYLQFFTSFVKEDVLDSDSVSRLMKVQQHMHFEDIAESFLPTFTVYPDTGNIENANSEAQKFLKSTRFELKYRNVTDILHPSVNVDELKVLVGNSDEEYDEEPVYSFFKKSDKEYGCGTLKLSERYVKQKKLFVVEVSRQSFSDLKCMMLVSQQFQMELISKQQVKIKAAQYRSNPFSLNWNELFQKYIKDSKEKLLKTKMAKITTDYKGCILIVKKLAGLKTESHILLAQLIIANQNAKHRKESILKNRRSFQYARINSHFQFQYNQDQTAGKALIYGYKHEVNINKKHAYSSSRQRFQNSQLDGSTLGNEKRRLLGKEIKTYRLYEGQLYNVDLQDREAYNQIFTEHFSESKKKEVNDQSSLQCYIFLGVILLGLALITFSVVLIIQFQSSSQLIQTDYIRRQNIQSFNIDFQRLLTLLRDQASGLISNFAQINTNQEIQESYGRIQQLKNSTLFDSTIYTINFQNLTMTGTLSELVDVILAHVTQIVDSKDLSIVEDIHTTCIEQINYMIEGAQSQVVTNINNQIARITTLKDALLYSSIGLVLLIYFLMILYCFKSNFKGKDKLADLMYTSDSEAKMLQQNAQKMKYAVEMARKNFDVDTQNLLNNTSDFKKRKNPKEAILSRQIVYTIGAITIVGFVVHMVCLFVFSFVFANKISDFQTIVQQGEYVTSVFPARCMLSNKIDHIGQLDPISLNSIRNNLSLIQHNMNGLLFSAPVSEFINTLYFYNSCQQQLRMFNYSLVNCSNTCPSFTISNPFEIGLALYFTRQNYYMSNNLTQNFADTGVFSNQFARIFTNLTVMIQGEGTNQLNQAFVIVALLNGFIILIDCSYILAFVIIYRYFRNQFQKIKEILFFFSTKLKGKGKGSDSDDEEEEVQSEDQSQESVLVKDSKTVNKGRRTTIQRKIDDNQ